MSVFNPDQLDHIKSLAELPPESRCWCGWYELGLCPHCPPGRTCAEKLAVQCRYCGNDGGPEGRPITHITTCPMRKEEGEHVWGETDIDWKATRACKRCGAVNTYNHGPNGPSPDIYERDGKVYAADPGCLPTTPDDAAGKEER